MSFEPDTPPEDFPTWKPNIIGSTPYVSSVTIPPPFGKDTVIAGSVPKYKYKEDTNIAEFALYIRETYSKYYIGKTNNIQAFDIWEALNDDPSSTHRDTAIKYLYRYGKKDGFNRKDLLKAMHYIIMLMYYHDKLHKKAK